MHPDMSDLQKKRKKPLKASAADLFRPWKRQNFRGPALTLRGFADFWGVQERTIQRHANAGKVPGLFKSGQRLKIRRCKASYEYGQQLREKTQWRSFSKQLASAVKKPSFQALGSVLELDMAKTGFQPSTSYPQPAWWNDEELGILDLLDESEQCVFQTSPQHFQILAEAVRLMTSGQLPTQGKIAAKLKMSRRTFIRRFPEMKQQKIKSVATLVLGYSMPEDRSEQRDFSYQTRGNRRPGA